MMYIIHALFMDEDDDLDSARVLNALESIDDDCDRNGINLVKIADRDYATRYFYIDNFWNETKVQSD